MQFHSIDFSCYEVWKRAYAMSSEHTADCSFANIYGWAPSYGLQYAFEDGLFWLGRLSERPLRLWMPLGDTQDVNWDQALSSFPAGTIIERVPIALAQSIRTRSSRVALYEETRDEDEYLYYQKSMATLEGRKLHKKRTHANTFERLYGVDYRTLTLENAEEIDQFCRVWLETQERSDDPSLLRELSAIHRILEFWRMDPTLRAGGLYIDNALVGFALGGPLDAKTFDIHIEKAFSQYRGVYQALVKHFADKTVTNEFEYIDREQDLGDAGLRFSKMTYQPVAFLKKALLVLN